MLLTGYVDESKPIIRKIFGKIHGALLKEGSEKLRKEYAKEWRELRDHKKKSITYAEFFKNQNMV